MNWRLFTLFRRAQPDGCAILKRLSGVYVVVPNAQVMDNERKCVVGHFPTYDAALERARFLACADNARKWA